VRANFDIDVLKSLFALTIATRVEISASGDNDLLSLSSLQGIPITSSRSGRQPLQGYRKNLTPVV
jgi:hypothetical protein